MGDDAGVGLISTLLSGLIRGAQSGAQAARAAAPFVQQGVTKGIRFADPRRLTPLVQQIQKGPLFRPIPIVEKAIQSTPVIKSLPEWARGAIGISTSPAGIAGDIGTTALFDKLTELPQMFAAKPKQPVNSAEAQRDFRKRFGIVYGGYEDPLLSDYGPPTPWVNIPGSVAYEQYMTSMNRGVNRPATGPRVDASTTQMIDIGAPAPRQAPRVTPVTPTAPPTPVISQAAYNAAITGTQAPANIPLSEFYAAQRSIGQYAEQGGELQRRLKEAGGAAGMTDEALMAWAQRNPDLALRELMKREKRTGMSVD
jgi:hypothetical protein